MYSPLLIGLNMKMQRQNIENLAMKLLVLKVAHLLALTNLSIHLGKIQGNALRKYLELHLRIDHSS